MVIIKDGNGVAVGGIRFLKMNDVLTNQIAKPIRLSPHVSPVFCGRLTKEGYPRTVGQVILGVVVETTKSPSEEVLA